MAGNELWRRGGAGLHVQLEWGEGNLCCYGTDKDTSKEHELGKKQSVGRRRQQESVHATCKTSLFLGGIVSLMLLQSTCQHFHFHPST